MRGPSYMATFDHLVAEEAGIPYSRVPAVTRALANVVAELLSTNGEVLIPGIGTLRLRINKPGRTLVELQSGRGVKIVRKVHVKNNVRIYFSKSAKLRTILKENGYGEIRSRRDD